MSILDAIPGVPWLRQALTTLATAAIVAGGMVLYYEGVPLGPVRDVPVFGTVAEIFLDGRVDRQRRAGFKAGQADERIAWEDARRRQIAANEAKRAEAQAQIDGLFENYLKLWQARQSALDVNSDLQRALAQSKAERETENAQNPDCPPRPAISRRVSRELNKVGR